jgi:nucleoside 2-deoxyribosyltransferase
MARCFVIQPFDRGRFDKRYKDVFEPAIRAAELEPYRVDRDPGVVIPIDDIETGIRDSDICLADITTNNPNVWFEFGLAIAGGKDVVLACSTERTEPYPFDVQHRAIVKYATESPSDFEALHTSIVERLKVLTERREALANVADLVPMKGEAGLSGHEIAALVVIAERCVSPGTSVAPGEVEGAMRKAGYTRIATTLSVRALIKKGLVETTVVYGELDHAWEEFQPTASGMQWLLDNQERLVLRRTREPEPPPSDDEVPF